MSQGAFPQLPLTFTEGQITDLVHYATSDANTDIDARVTKAFVDALAVDADTVDGQHFTDIQSDTAGQIAAATSDYLPLAGGTLTGNVTISKAGPLIKMDNANTVDPLDYWRIRATADILAVEYWDDSAATVKRVIGFEGGSIRPEAPLDGQIPLGTAGQAFGNSYINKVFLVDGGPAFPALGFADGSNTGLYRLPGDGSLGVTVNGVQMVRVTDAVAQFTVHVRPLTDEVYDLGSAAFRWGEGFINRLRMVSSPSETVAINGASGTTQTLNVAVASIFDVTLSANCTFTFSGAVASTGNSFTLYCRQDATGSRLATWPAAVEWSDGLAPTLSTAANALDVFTFVTVDGGTTWQGFVGGLAFS